MPYQTSPVCVEVDQPRLSGPSERESDRTVVTTRICCARTSQCQLSVTTSTSYGACLDMYWSRYKVQGGLEGAAVWSSDCAFPSLKPRRTDDEGRRPRFAGGGAKAKKV